MGVGESIEKEEYRRLSVGVGVGKSVELTETRAEAGAGKEAQEMALWINRAAGDLMGQEVVVYCEMGAASGKSAGGAPIGSAALCSSSHTPRKRDKSLECVCVCVCVCVCADGWGVEGAYWACILPPRPPGLWRPPSVCGMLLMLYLALSGVVSMRMRSSELSPLPKLFIHAPWRAGRQYREAGKPFTPELRSHAVQQSASQHGSCSSRSHSSSQSRRSSSL